MLIHYSHLYVLQYHYLIEKMMMLLLRLYLCSHVHAHRLPHNLKTCAFDKHHKSRRVDLITYKAKLATSTIPWRLTGKTVLYACTCTCSCSCIPYERTHTRETNTRTCYGTSRQRGGVADTLSSDGMTHIQ